MPDTQNLEKKAAAWAVMSHEGRTYADGPYTDHLKLVVRLLKHYGFGSPEFLAAGWLHDDIEDTETTLEQIQAEFGDRVAELVFAVTDEEGKNRAERHRKTYPKIAATPGATVIKLADRIANVSSCWNTRDAKLFMYRKEHGGFRDALYREEASRTVLAMWVELDNLLGWDAWTAREHARKKRR